jgi:hypothetical protein
MIRGALKAEYNAAKTPAEKEATTYYKLMQLPHFESIFDYKNYIAGYSEQPNTDEALQSQKSEESLERYLRELKYNVQYNLNPNVDPAGHTQDSKAKRKRLEEAYELTKKIIDLKKASVASPSKWDKDISWLSLYTGSNRDIDNPYIEIYSKLLDERKNKAYSRLYSINALYKEYLQYALKDYHKRKGMSPPELLGNQKASGGIWNNINPVEF